MDIPPYVEALTGGIGASLANVLIYPLDLAAARIQTRTRGDGYSDLPTALRTIYEAGGLPAFYQGISSDTLSTALSNFLYFYIYAALHKLSRKRKTALEELLIGSLAGIFSRLVTTPLSTVTVRKQTAAKTRQKDTEKGVQAVEDEDDDESDYSAVTSISIAKDIYESQGLSGFWRGYTSACILVSLNFAHCDKF